MVYLFDKVPLQYIKFNIWDKRVLSYDLKHIFLLSLAYAALFEVTSPSLELCEL